MITAIDIETSAGGCASFEYWRSDFKIDSMSLAWREGADIKHWFSTDPLRIAQKLLALSKSNTPLIAHNLAFEYGVITKLYPKIPLNWQSDSMRLCQHYDAGGAEFDGEPALSTEQLISLELGESTEEDFQKFYNKSKGLSLEACAIRLLEPQHHNHKGPAHDWLKEHKGIKKDFGSHLHLLPPDILESYNNADTLVTLLLFEEAQYKLGDFDWQRDWKLYFNRIQLMAQAYTRGTLVNRPHLFEYIREIETELAAMENAFRERFKEELREVARLRREELVRDWANDPTLKSDRARANRLAAIESGSKDHLWATFNINSNQQLEILFCNVLKFEPKFRTKTEKPSFKSSHLHQFGEGGSILQKRKKRILVLNQAVNLYISSQFDGRTHPSMRVSGTRTNRISGGHL